jgi:hypothetical protein
MCVNRLDDSKEMQGVCWRGKHKQLKGSVEGIDPRDFFPLPQYSEHTFVAWYNV